MHSYEEYKDLTLDKIKPENNNKFFSKINKNTSDKKDTSPLKKILKNKKK